MRTFPETVLALALTAAPCLAGCSAVVGDLGGYTEDIAACREDADRNQVRDLRFALRDMTAHVDAYFEISITDRATGGLRSRFILEPLGAPSVDLMIERSVPAGDALDLEFYADINGNRVVDNPSSTEDRSRDHTWVRPICSDGDQYFAHIFEFQPIVDIVPVGSGRYRLSLTNIPTALQTAMVETRLVFDGGGADQDRTVAMYRRGTAEASSEMIVPGIIDNGNAYVVLYYFDADDDGEPSGGDLFCGLRRNATGDDLDIELDVAAEMTAGNCDLNALDPAQVP